jgi:hypothetical protein
VAGRSQARWGSLVVAVAGTCVALAGCSGSSTSANNPSVSLPSGAVTVPPTPVAGGAGSVGKLTGNFCNDFRNIGTSFQLPASAQGSGSAAERQGLHYLNKLQAYFTGLAGEAPHQVSSDLRTIAADLQRTVAAVSSKNLSSLQKADQQLQSLTTNGATGNAFRNLVGYVVTKCGA